jgi:hypothetical protein
MVLPESFLRVRTLSSSVEYYPMDPCGCGWEGGMSPQTDSLIPAWMDREGWEKVEYKIWAKSLTPSKSSKPQRPSTLYIYILIELNKKPITIKEKSTPFRKLDYKNLSFYSLSSMSSKALFALLLLIVASYSLKLNVRPKWCSNVEKALWRCKLGMRKGYQRLIKYWKLITSG